MYINKNMLFNICMRIILKDLFVVCVFYSYIEIRVNLI